MDGHRPLGIVAASWWIGRLTSGAVPMYVMMYVRISHGRARMSLIIRHVR